jgi:YidC/Oxa1 family membrane protein insertase
MESGGLRSPEITMTDATIWNQYFIWPITNILVYLYKFFESLGLPGPLGFAIIAVTLFIKLILWPATQSQMKSAKKFQAMKPKIDELKEKHKGDNQGLQKAQMELFKTEGYNPAAGCLPLLVQMPILFALYGVFSQVFLSTDLNQAVQNINKILYPFVPQLTNLDLSFLGINLALRPNQWQQFGYWLFLIPVGTAALQWYQTKLMMPPSTPAATKPVAEPKKKTKEITKKEDEKKEEKNPEDMAVEMQKQMMVIMPLMIGFTSYTFPIGLALYWNLFSVFGIIQQLFINKSYGKTN